MPFKIENGVLIKYMEEDGVTEITIPDCVTSIGEAAFFGCINLKSIIIPDSVESIEKDSFFRCGNLREIDVSEKNQNFCSCDGVLYSKDMKILIKYPAKKEKEEFITPDSVESINDAAFYINQNLKNIVLSDSVTNIGKNAFRYCRSLESITIPDSIKFINKSAFSDETKIIICKGNARIPVILNGRGFSYDYEQVLNKIIISDIDDCQQYFSKLGFRYKIAVAMSIISAYPDKTYYSDYLKSSAKNIVRLFIDEENIEQLYRFLELGFVTEKNIDSLISYAVEHTQNGGSSEPQIVLSKYKSDNFSANSADTFDKFILP